MSLFRTLLKSLYFRIALVVFIALAITSQTLSNKVTPFISKPDPHSSYRRLLPGSLFDNLQESISQNASAQAQEEAIEAVCRAHYFPPWHGSGRKVYDLVMISSELDWLEIRLHTLSPHVDYFVVVESATSFTGVPKPLVLQDNWDRFAAFHHKIIYKVIEDTIEFKDGNQWDHEHFLRDSMLTGVFPSLAGTEKEARKGDVLIVSDLDEIIRPETAMILRYCDFPARFRLRTRFFYYAYQWAHRNGDWDHPQATTYSGSIESTLNPEALRKDLNGNRTPLWTWAKSLKPTETAPKEALDAEAAQMHDSGWHCSSCFKTIAQVQAKLNGFSHVEFNSAENRDPATIIDRYKHGLDLFGRPSDEWAFDKVDVTDMPQYVEEQHNKTGRFGYLIDRNSRYAEFEDGESMLRAAP